MYILLPLFFDFFIQVVYHQLLNIIQIYAQKESFIIPGKCI